MCRPAIWHQVKYEYKQLNNRAMDLDELKAKLENSNEVVYPTGDYDKRERIAEPTTEGKSALPIHSVMPRYFYKDGTEACVGDICFYSEADEDGNWHYADGIYEMTKLNNDIYPKAHIITIDDAKTFIDHDEEESNMVSLKYGIEDFVKIGVRGQNDDMLTKEYAMEHYTFNEA
jgi:hypothetical protein